MITLINKDKQKIDIENTGDGTAIQRVLDRLKVVEVTSEVLDLAFEITFSAVESALKCGFRTLVAVDNNEMYIKLSKDDGEAFLKLLDVCTKYTKYGI